MQHRSHILSAQQFAGLVVEPFEVAGLQCPRVRQSEHQRLQRAELAVEVAGRPDRRFAHHVGTQLLLAARCMVDQERREAQEWEHDRNHQDGDIAMNRQCGAHGDNEA